MVPVTRYIIEGKKLLVSLLFRLVSFQEKASLSNSQLHGTTNTVIHSTVWNGAPVNAYHGCEGNEDGHYFFGMVATLIFLAIIYLTLILLIKMQNDKMEALQEKLKEFNDCMDQFQDTLNSTMTEEY